MKILGIEIETKTDILAAAAFLISVIGIIGQIALFIRGPDLELYTPEQVTIAPKAYKEGDSIKKYTVVAATMTYYNSGSIGFHDTIKNEYVIFKIGNAKYKLSWYKFIQSDVDKENASELDFNVIEDSKPKQVNARGVESHETLFVPHYHEDYLPWDEFRNKIKSMKKIIFKFTFESFSGRVESKYCEVDVPSINFHLKAKDWVSLVTTETKGSERNF